MLLVPPTCDIRRPAARVPVRRIALKGVHAHFLHGVHRRIVRHAPSRSSGAPSTSSCSSATARRHREAQMARVVERPVELGVAAGNHPIASRASTSGVRPFKGRFSTRGIDHRARGGAGRVQQRVCRDRNRLGLLALFQPNVDPDPVSGTHLDTVPNVMFETGRFRLQPVRARRQEWDRVLTTGAGGRLERPPCHQGHRDLGVRHEADWASVTRPVIVPRNS